jgi:hypothetical protein
MADDFAMNFRKNRGQPPVVRETAAPSEGIPTSWLVIGAAAIGFAGFAFTSPGLIGNGLLGLLRSSPAPVAAPAEAPPGPRVMAAVPGVREVEGGSVTGMSLVGTRELAQSYVPVGPVIMRTASSFVEIDSPRLVLPPLGPARTNRALLDYSAKLGNELRPLGFTPCDRHLRFLAAANVNLFVASFFPPRTPINTSAPANAAFWNKAEASAVRRIAQELAEKGALGPTDFGIDTSPEVKGLFDGIRLGQPSCG